MILLLGFVALLLLILVVQTPLGRQVFWFVLFIAMLVGLVAFFWIGHQIMHPPA